MQNGQTQLNRRNAPSNRIKPELQFSEETNFSRYTAASSGTRPPVVGREVTLDPGRTKRYDSSEDHLSKYLKALEQKTAAGQRRASASKDGNFSDISLSSDSDPKNVTLGRAASFLKSNVPKTSGQGPGTNAAAKTEAVNFPPARTSNALQRAQAFSDKYKPERKPSEDGARAVKPNNEFPEEAHISDQSESDSLSRSASSSFGQGLLNIKDLIDLPWLSDGGPSERSEHSGASLPAKISSFEDSPEPIADVSLSPVNVNSHSSQRRPPSAGSSDEDVSDYEEDFEEESDPSSGSSPAAEDSTSKKFSESQNSEDETSGVPDAKSSLESSSEEAAPVRRKMTHVEKTQPAGRSLPKVRNGVSKETQTAAVFASEGPSSNVIVLRNIPQAARPTFPSYPEGFSLHYPPVAALDEMVRQHLSTIRLFKDSQQRSYETLVTALKPNFQYTTWERTQKVLERRRQRRHCRSKD